MINLLLELLKMIIGGTVFLTVFIIGIFYTFVKHIIFFDYKIVTQLVPIVRSVTLSIDGIACAGAGELLNDALRIKGNIKYGKWYQTISAVTGLIFMYEKDTKLRVILDKILGKKHCVDAITEQDNYYYKNSIK